MPARCQYKGKSAAQRKVINRKGEKGSENKRERERKNNPTASAFE